MNTNDSVPGKATQTPKMAKGSKGGSDGGVPSQNSSPSAKKALPLFCEMCHKVVSACITPNVNESKALTKMIRNLCNHLQLRSTSIPVVRQGERVFLCKDCEKNLKTVLDLQEVLEKIRGKVTQMLNQIEKTVSDSEVIKKDTTHHHSKGHIRQLRTMIFEGYQDKLRKTYEKRNTTTLNLVENQQKDPIPSQSVLATDPLAKELDNDDDDDDEIQILEPAPSSSASMQASSGIDSSSPFIGNKGPGSFRDDDDDRDEEKVEPLEPLDDVIDEDDNKTEMDVLGHLEQDMQHGNGDGPNSDEEQENPNEEDEAEKKQDCEALTIDPNEPKWIFNEVEILKCIGSKPGFKYLRCSTCNFTIEIPNGSTRSSRPMIEMKRHINSAHGKQQAEEDLELILDDTEEEQHVCTFCSRSFTRKHYLRLHLPTHANLMQPRERTRPPAEIPTFEPGSQAEFLYHLGLVQVVVNPEERRGIAGDTANGDD